MNFKNWSNIKFFIFIFGVFILGMILSPKKTYTNDKNKSINQVSDELRNKNTETPIPTIQTIVNEDIVKKNIGDEIILKDISFKVTSSSEQNVISSKFSSSQSSSENAKFVVVNIDVTNVTKTEFVLYADYIFKLVDNKDREFKHYQNAIGHADIYKLLLSKHLSPSIKVSGFLIFEVPNDSSNYKLVTIDSKPQYEIVLR